MLNIFLESAQTLYWLEQTNFKNFIVSRNIPAWLSDTKLPKVAFLEVFDFDSDTTEKISQLCKHADTVLLFVHELIEVDLIKNFDLPNVVFFISGILNFDLKFAEVKFYSYFFSSTIDFYQTYPPVLTKCSNGSFDVLLGRRKTHRDIVYDNIDRTKNVVRYFPTYVDNNIQTYNQSEFEWPDTDLTVQDPLYMTAGEVTVNGTIVSLSQIIPTNIYNRTEYTLVAETCFDNQWSFFTEKIVKPILAKRMFVVASGQHYLRNLQNLGFKTFSNVINETYDSVDELDQRMQMVCNIANSKLNHLAIDAVVDHNYHHMLNTDWNKAMFQNIELSLLRI